MQTKISCLTVHRSPNIVPVYVLWHITKAIWHQIRPQHESCGNPKKGKSVKERTSQGSFRNGPGAIGENYTLKILGNMLNILVLSSLNLER